VPYEISRENDYLLIRLSGAFCGGEMLEATRKLHELEDGRPAINRVTDFSAVEKLDIGFHDVHALAEVRRSVTFDRPIKSAFVACQPLHIGYARMFQTLNDNPAVEIRIVADMAEALAWFRQ
jgi:hypothetical protein